VYTRSIFYRLVRGMIPASGLVMSQSIAKPLKDYEDNLAHVVVAKQLLKAGYPVDPGDRVDMVFLDNPSKRACDKAWPLKLFDPKVHALDVPFYFKKIKGPFERVLEHVLTKSEMAYVFTLSAYKNNCQSVAQFLSVPPEEESEDEETPDVLGPQKPAKQVRTAAMDKKPTRKRFKMKQGSIENFLVKKPKIEETRDEAGAHEDEWAGEE